MKRYSSWALSLLLLSYTTFQGSTVYAASASVPLSSSEVTITNNVGKSDIIYVNDVMGGDTINVYNAAAGGKLIGKTTVSGSKTDATINVSQLGTNAGSVYISVTSKGMTESTRTEVDYDAEAISDDPLAENVTITNNADRADTIYVSGLAQGDLVKLYTSAAKGKLLGSAIVGTNKTDTKLSISQLGANGGSIYVSVTSKGMKESNRVKVDFSPEGQSENVDPENVTITNNAGKTDTIYISGLASGDKVRVYNAATKGKLLATSTVSLNSTETKLSVSQLGVYGGNVYISVASPGMTESTRTKVNFSAEGQVDPILASNVTITNNSGKSDTVYVTGLTSGDKINVYNAVSNGRLIGSATAGSDGSATANIGQLGVSAGSAYISVTSSGLLESYRVKINYDAESQSSELNASNIAVTNNSGKADTVYVSGLVEGNVIKVYNAATGGTLLGTATVAANATDATVSISQLGIDSGTVYVSLTDKNQLESNRIPVNYIAESKSSDLSANNIVVTNNSGAADTVQVSGVSSGEVVNVYDAEKGGNLLGTATVASDATSSTVSISQLGTSKGSVYVSLKDTNKLEGDRIKVDYDAEKVSINIDPNNIVVTNNSGKSDTVYVSNLNSGDVVNVYDSLNGGTKLGTATVGDSATFATVSINQLGINAGSVYVSVTSKNKVESSRIEKSYSEETKSSSLDSNNIVVTNNVGSADTVQVSGVSSGDIINVYDAEKGGNLLGTATVASGATSATVSISQLGSNAGGVYVSLTNSNKLEGDRTEADYSAEVASNPLDASNISVTNRSGSADTVSIAGASQNDVINVYDLAKGGTLLGTVTVAAGETKASISITQLGTDAGSIYVSRTSSNKSESTRVKVDYDAEPKSTAPSTSNIIVTNNAGINDTVEVKSLSVGDLVQVYDSATGGTLLGSATVESNATEATVSISQLGTAGGSIYISVTSKNKSESGRTQVGFTAEAKSNLPDVNKINIANNASMASTVKVAGLTNGDIIKVYDSATGGILIGTATVGTYDTSAIVSVTQLGESQGKVYVTVTSTGKLESDRTEAAYAAKTASTAPSESSIVVTNNASKSDTVKITGLQPNDIINVYDAVTGGNLLGTATVASNAMEGTVSISQLGSNKGTVYISVTSTGKTESSRTVKDYSAESQSDPLGTSDVTIENNAGTADTITVTGVSEGDIIKVYNTETGGTVIGTATVASGESQAIVTISQLGTTGGTVYVSTIRSGYTESSRTAANYSAESTAPIAGNISIVNNAVISDTIDVTGLSEGDIVKVYDASTGGNLIGYAIVPSGSSKSTVTVSQLTTGAGSVYISVTNFGKGESKRTRADYIAEQTSASLYAGNVNIVNNPSGTSDVITVNNLASSDVIKVYDALVGGNLIGTATVSSNGTSATITISQLSAAAGNVYISITNLGKNESSRTQVGYVAEK